MESHGTIRMISLYFVLILIYTHGDKWVGTVEQEGEICEYSFPIAKSCSGLPTLPLGHLLIILRHILQCPKTIRRNSSMSRARIQHPRQVGYRPQHCTSRSIQLVCKFFEWKNFGVCNAFFRIKKTDRSTQHLHSGNSLSNQGCVFLLGDCPD